MCPLSLLSAYIRFDILLYTYIACCLLELSISKLMGFPPTQTPKLYPPALQLRLYQAFIFSIPVLFSIILFLLFYLFYLKRRASNLSTPRPVLPTSFTQQPSSVLLLLSTNYILLQQQQQQPANFQLSLKKDDRNKLPIVLFDEELRTRDMQCSVCLGEFEMKEELLQVPSCKHLFHVECIHHWLHSNSTCPLCRCSVTVTVIPTTKTHTPIPIPAILPEPLPPTPLYQQHMPS